jgi:hypothetical protein
MRFRREPAAALLAAALIAGCGGGGPPPRAVTGVLDLDTRRGDAAVGLTSAPVFSFTGRVDPSGSRVEVSDGVVRQEPSDRFTVATAFIRGASKVLRLRATNPGYRPWAVSVIVKRSAPPRVRVPERDDEAPSAAIVLEPAGGTAVVQPSPSRAGERAPVVGLAEPRFRVAAAVRDRRGGTGRIRIVVTSTIRCGAAATPHVRVVPPAQIVNIALPPGAAAPAERVRRLREDVPAACSTAGEVSAEGTDAHGRQAVTAHIGFRYP